MEHVTMECIGIKNRGDYYAADSMITNLMWKVLYQWKKKKLVFCGHSQGGAVAWYLALLACCEKVLAFE